MYRVAGICCGDPAPADNLFPVADWPREAWECETKKKSITRAEEAVMHVGLCSDDETTCIAAREGIPVS